MEGTRSASLIWNHKYDFIATEEQVLELTKGVDTSKACGYDGVGNRIIKMCSDGFHVYFTRFINMSFSLGQFPSEWKLANVIPIFKNDNPWLKVNNRPVSLLASSSKICERIVFFYLNNLCWRLFFFINSSLVSDLVIQQSANWFSLYNREVRAVFLDINKAFDKVWHAGLLCKLEALGTTALTSMVWKLFA